MTRFARDVRLIPIVLFATISLLALKVSGLVFDGGYTLAERMQARYRGDLQITSRESVPDQPRIVLTEKYAKPGAAGSRQPWAQEMFSFNGGNTSDVTGSVGAAEEKPSDPALKVSDKPPDPTKLEVAGAAIPLEPGRIASPGERAVLERLQTRRQELDTRNRELEMRENLLKAAEKRAGGKVAELKDTESRVNTAMGTRDKVEAERFKSIVSDVREHEAQGCRADFRSPRHEDPGRRLHPDQSAKNVGNPGANVAGCGRAADRRTCQQGQCSAQNTKP